MMRYDVQNLLPVGSTLDGYQFTAEGNAVALRCATVPLPVTRDWDNAAVIGQCLELQQEEDGTVTAIVEVPTIGPGERLGLCAWLGTLTEDWVDSTGRTWRQGERIVWAIDALTLTTRPDPCGDVQTITPRRGGSA